MGTRLAVLKSREDTNKPTKCYNVNEWIEGPPRGSVLDNEDGFPNRMRVQLRRQVPVSPYVRWNISLLRKYLLNTGSSSKKKHLVVSMNFECVLYRICKGVCCQPFVYGMRRLGI